MMPIDAHSDDEFAHLVQRAVAMPDAPADLVQAAIGLWAETRATTLSETARAGLRLVRGVLSFDSWARQPWALTMRSVSSDTRHLLFSAMGRDIDLRIQSAGGRHSLMGQVLGPDEEGFLVLSASSDDAPVRLEARSTRLSALGEFCVDGVDAGTYVISLRMGTDEIVLPPIDVGERV